MQSINTCVDRFSLKRWYTRHPLPECLDHDRPYFFTAFNYNMAGFSKPLIMMRDIYTYLCFSICTHHIFAYVYIYMYISMYTHLCLPDEPSCLEAGHKVQVQRLEETAGKSQKGVWLGMWWGDPEVGTNKLCGRLGPSSRDCRHMWASRNLHKRYIFLFAEKVPFSIDISYFQSSFLCRWCWICFWCGRRSTWALWNSRSWAFGTSHCETCPIWRICREAPGCSRHGRSFFVCLILGWKSMILCKGSSRFSKVMQEDWYTKTSPLWLPLQNKIDWSTEVAYLQAFLYIHFQVFLVDLNQEAKTAATPAWLRHWPGLILILDRPFLVEPWCQISLWRYWNQSTDLAVYIEDDIHEAP